MEDIIFLPTKAASLFKTLQTARPNHHLIMADFSSLPDVQIRGRLAPLVTSKVTTFSEFYFPLLSMPGISCLSETMAWDT